MKSDKNQISINAKWAVGQTIISAVILFFLYKFLLNELGAAKLGLWSLILASTSLAKLGELGFSNATVRFVGKYIGEGQPQSAAEVLETALLSISLPFLALAACAIPLVGIALPVFIPATHVADALTIIPWAMLALWLGVTSGLVQSAVDGCGRMDQKNMVLIAANFIYLGFSVYLTPIFGLKGVAIAQAIQAAISMAIMWILVRTHLPNLPLIPTRWSKSRFSEVSGFALTMQGASIAGMFVEPITKALISRFSGLEFLAFYEMANQVVSRARGVLISGFQAIIPQFSANNDIKKHREIFLRSQKNVINMGIPFMSIVMIAFPVISQIWIGRVETTFIISGQILGATWLLVTLLMPAYFFLVGTGKGTPVAIAQIITLLCTIAFGWLGGSYFSGIGPVAGAASALIIGNIYFYLIASKILFNSTHEVPMPKWVLLQMITRICTCFAIVSLNFLATKYAKNLSEQIFILAAFSIATISFAFVSRK